MSPQEVVEEEAKPRRSMLGGRATAARGTIAMLGVLPRDDLDNDETMSTEMLPGQGVMTVNEATTNMITTMIGAGVLAFPSITAGLGWALSPFMIAVAGSLNTYVCLVLLWVLERASKKKQIDTLRDVGIVCFGPRGGPVLEWTLTVFMFCIACVLIVLIAENMNFLYKWEVKWWTGACGGALTVIAFVRDISVLSKLAFLGVCATFMYVLGIAGASAVAVSSYPAESRTHSVWPTGENATVMAMCGSFAVLLFGFHCVSLIPSFYKDMKEPELLGTAIVRANAFAVALYMIVGLVGYYGFGEHVQGNVVYSMCAAPGCDGKPMPPEYEPKPTLGDLAAGGQAAGDRMSWGYLIGISVVVNLAVTLPLICYVLFTSIERAFVALQEDRMKSTGVRIVCLVAVTGFGMMIPYFIEMLSIVASVMIVLIGLAMPPLLALRLDTNEGKGLNWRYVLLVVLSVFLMTLGLKDALSGLLQKLAEEA